MRVLNVSYVIPDDMIADEAFDLIKLPKQIGIDTWRLLDDDDDSETGCVERYLLYLLDFTHRSDLEECITPMSFDQWDELSC